MKRIFLLLLLLASFCITNIHGQPIIKVRDSLKQLLQKEKTDTGRVLLLADLGFLYIGSKPDTTMLLALEALTLSKRIRYIKGEAVSLNRIGNAFYNLGNYPKSMESYLQALKINEKINNIDGLARNHNNIGTIYRDQGDSRKALEYSLKAKYLAEKINNKDGLSISLANIAENYYRLKIFDSARLSAQQAYDVSDSISNPRSTGISLFIMGEIHFETGQNTLALEYYRLSIPFLEKAENGTGLSRTYHGVAKAFEKNGQNDSALFYANKALRISRENGFTKQTLDASSFLSSFYKNSRNADSAFYYLEVAKAANDSLFSQQNVNQFQSLAFDEKLRQQDIAVAELKAKEERKHNLQYAAITIGLITFIILFFALSRSIIVKTKFIEFFSVLGLLAIFK